MKRNQIPLIASVLLLAGCAVPPPVVESGAPSLTAPATSDVVKRQDLVGYSFFDGKLEIPQSAQATAFSPYATPVISVSTGVGKHVERGESIVLLTIPGSDAATTTAKADVNAAQANLSALRGAGSDPVREAQAAYDVAQRAEKEARSTVANGGQADIEFTVQVRKDAAAALKLAKQEMQDSLQPSKDAVAQAAFNLKSAKEDAAKGIVRAPISGTVVSLEAKPGMDANAKQTLATIINFGAVRVQGMVPAELKDLVIKGSRVIVAMNGTSADPIDGQVSDVTVAPPTKGQAGAGYLAVITLLKPGSWSNTSISVKRIGIKTGTAKNALVVPVGAINTVEGKTMVSVKNGDSWTDTVVEVGLSDGALAEIKSGIKEGDTVKIRKSA